MNSNCLFYIFCTLWDNHIWEFSGHSWKRITSFLKLSQQAELWPGLIQSWLRLLLGSSHRSVYVGCSSDVQKVLCQHVNSPDSIVKASQKHLDHGTWYDIKQRKLRHRLTKWGVQKNSVFPMGKSVLKKSSWKSCRSFAKAQFSVT